MNRELIINAETSEVVIALVENKKLVELQKEKHDSNFAVGDLYYGRVKKLVSGLNAAFVDVGYEKDAFLHYLDLGPQLKSLQKFTKQAHNGSLNTPSLDSFELEPEIDKNGKIEQVLSLNQHILLQIAKEPISTKGPRITCEISLAGRFIVLVPFSDKVSCSQKIKSREERNRLKTLIRSIKPKNFGVIIRTVAENRKVAELDSDLQNLVHKWEIVHRNLKNAKSPTKILGEINRTNSIIRDLLNASFNRIFVNNQKLFDEIQNYLHAIAPDRMEILKFYKNGLPIFENFGLEKQIKALFGRHVTLASGGYLVIEHTEALHVIDVNSGNTGKNLENQEENAIKVNLEAAEEIARQLRLRDMGGIIVVDFIDMKKTDHKKQLFEKFKEFMAADRAKHQILPPSKFGLVQITRQRVRPEMDIKTTEFIPTVDGKSTEVQATILLVDEIELKLKNIVTNLKPAGITLHCHPFLEAYFKKGFNNIQYKWLIKFKKWVKIIPRSNYPLMEYHFFNKKNEELIP